MALTKQTKQDLILNVKGYLDNVASDSYIKEQIATLGYAEERIQEGFSQWEKSRSSRERQLSARNKAIALHTKLEEIFAVHHKTFMDDRRLFRSTFMREIPVKEKLGLYGSRRRNVANYLEQARTLYTTLLKEKEILGRLAKFNITAETVQSRLAGLTEVEKAYGAFTAADKEAQDATDECDREVQKLQDWVRILQDACRIVLKGKKQLLEKVGILVRSSKPRKKKETDGTENDNTEDIESSGSSDAAQKTGEE